MVATVTLNIPDEVYQRLALNARATERSIEDILAYVLKVGSPPDWQDVPAEYRADLQGLDALSDAALGQLAAGKMTDLRLDRYDELLDLNAAGALSGADREELRQLRQESERFMLRKAQAAVLLRWRGFQVVAG
jgi:NADP-dependent 3-hydroxy acid dehydrogenase YdfG